MCGTIFWSGAVTSWSLVGTQPSVKPQIVVFTVLDGLNKWHIMCELEVLVDCVISEHSQASCFPLPPVCMLS